MAHLRIVIPDALDEELRKNTEHRKGALSEFVTKAIRNELRKK